MINLCLKETRCMRCKHYIIPTKDYIPKCKAFPKRIPKEIFSEEFDHTKPYPGDNGIQFEPSADEE